MAEGCDLPKHQVTESNLKRLAAFSHFYGAAKACVALQFMLAVPAAIPWHGLCGRFQP
jgi:hypothetical protein